MHPAIEAAKRGIEKLGWISSTMFADERGDETVDLETARYGCLLAAIAHGAGITMDHVSGEGILVFLDEKFPELRTLVIAPGTHRTSKLRDIAMEISDEAGCTSGYRTEAQTALRALKVLPVGDPRDPRLIALDYLESQLALIERDEAAKAAEPELVAMM